MNPHTFLRTALLLTLLAGTLVLTACGGDSASRAAIAADGSSTVAPFTQAAAELFKDENPDVNVTVGVSGTGGGFERFCIGETDLSDASRPIEDDEAAACEKAGIEYLEIRVATDALTVAVNPQNDWTDCLTVDQLKQIWEPSSKVGNWDQVEDASFPSMALKLFGPGTDSGTFDYFTAEIVGEEGASRSDYQASENDNVLVQGVSGEKGGLGYFGFSYFEQNTDRLKAVAIDGGNGCVAPSAEAAQDGSYAPLSRPLFIYVKKSALERQSVKEFLQFALTSGAQIAERAKMIPLSSEQTQAELTKLDAA